MTQEYEKYKNNMESVANRIAEDTDDVALECLKDMTNQTPTFIEEKIEEWKNSELAKRVNSTEMFAINHHFPEWNKGENIPDFLKQSLTEAIEQGRTQTLTEVMGKIDEMKKEEDGFNNNKRDFRCNCTGSGVCYAHLKCRTYNEALSDIKSLLEEMK